MKRIIILLVIAPVFSFSQNRLNQLADSIKKNNLLLQAINQENIAFERTLQQNLRPADLEAEFTNLWNGSEYGREISLSQSFDFPTNTIREKKIIAHRVLAMDYKKRMEEDNLLFEAKTIFIECVYLNQRMKLLNKRRQLLEKMQLDFAKKLDAGDGNVLELNQSKIELFRIAKQQLEMENFYHEKQARIRVLNGGNQFEIQDTIYPVLPNIEGLQHIKEHLVLYDPRHAWMEEEMKATDSKIALGKSLWLPQIKLGYKSEQTPVQTLNGVRLGISFPLWKTYGSSQTAKIEYAAAMLRHLDHVAEHRQEMETLYAKLESLKKSKEMGYEIIATGNMENLLKKSFGLGQISSIDFFTSLNGYYQAVEDFLHTEMEYQLCWLQLTRYENLNPN